MSHWRVIDSAGHFTGGEWCTYESACTWARHFVRGFWTVVQCDRYGNRVP